MTVVVFIIILGFLVLAHELGHFVTARLNGVRVDEFGLGLPPRMFGVIKEEGRWTWVWGRRGISEDEGCMYPINWLPIGGFVRIKGEDGSYENESDSFSAKAVWRRIVILGSGVTMNFVLAMLLLSLVFAIGVPTVISTEQIAQGKAREVTVQVLEVLPESPALKAGIRQGDRIRGVDGQAVTDIEMLRSYLKKQKGQEVVLQLGGNENTDREVAVMPEQLPQTPHVGIGVGLVQTGIVTYSWREALWAGVRETFFLIGEIIHSIGQVVSSLFAGVSPGLDVSGPVGIAVMTGEVVRLGFVYALQFAALLSINLAIINILPFPALDGGRILFLVIGKVKGKAIDKKIEGMVHNVGFALLIGLIALVTFRDIVKLF